MLRLLDHSKCRTNFEFRNIHFNKTYLGLQERRRSSLPQGNFNTTTWPLVQMCKSGRRNPE